jgi:hypothetical protein
MYKPVQQCTHCGASLTLDDMRGTECPYCRTVYPHHSQAAQHAQVVGQVMNNMMAQQAQIQNQWRGAFGVPPINQPGYPPVHPHPMLHVHVEQSTRLARNIMLIVIVSTVGVMVLVGVIVALTLML